MKIFSIFAIPTLLFLFLIFLKIGVMFFGGGYVVISIIHRELVTNLHLLTEQEFIDGTAISQLTPGPVAILATFAGYCISGISGALVSTFAMFLPGISLMMFLSKKYEEIKNSSFAYNVLNTMIPVIVGLLFFTCFQLSKSTITSWQGVILIIFYLILILRFKISPAILITIAAVSGLIFKF